MLLGLQELMFILVTGSILFVVLFLVIAFLTIRKLLKQEHLTTNKDFSKMNTWIRIRDTNLNIYAYLGGGNADKINRVLACPPRPATEVGVSHLTDTIPRWQYATMAGWWLSCFKNDSVETVGALHVKTSALANRQCPVLKRWYRRNGKPTRENRKITNSLGETGKRRSKVGGRDPGTVIASFVRPSQLG